MLKRSFPCAVYFVEEDTEVRKVYLKLQSKSTVLSVRLLLRLQLAIEHLHNECKFPFEQETNHYP